MHSQQTRLGLLLFNSEITFRLAYFVRTLAITSLVLLWICVRFDMNTCKKEIQLKHVWIVVDTADDVLCYGLYLPWIISDCMERQDASCVFNNWFSASDVRLRQVRRCVSINVSAVASNVASSGLSLTEQESSLYLICHVYVTWFGDN